MVEKIAIELFITFFLTSENGMDWQVLNFTRKRESGYRPVGLAIRIIVQKLKTKVGNSHF